MLSPKNKTYEFVKEDLLTVNEKQIHACRFILLGGDGKATLLLDTEANTQSEWLILPSHSRESGK